MVNKKRKKSFIDIHTVKKLLLAGFTVIIAGVVISIFGVVEESAAGSGWLLANSNYFYAAPTITLEVKYKPLSAESTDKKDGTDRQETEIITSDDEKEQEPETGQEDDNMAISSGDNDEQHQEQQEQQEQQAVEDDDKDAGVVPPHHNALIISRLTEKHSLHTEINVDNITSNDQVFIDVFSGDVQSGETTADSVFISFENEEGTIETVRIGLDAEQGGGIDNITVLDGVSTALPDNTELQDAHHLDDASLGLDQIKSPVIVILPDTDERFYFTDGKKLKEQVFSKDYGIESVRAVRDELEIRLIRK